MDRETVRRIATLSRLDIAEDQEASLASDMAKILAFVEQLNDVDTKGVAPMTGPLITGTEMTSPSEMTLRRRLDKVTDGGAPDPVLANAPEQTAGYFVVPKVVE